MATGPPEERPLARSWGGWLVRSGAESGREGMEGGPGRRSTMCLARRRPARGCSRGRISARGLGRGLVRRDHTRRRSLGRLSRRGSPLVSRLLGPYRKQPCNVTDVREAFDSEHKRIAAQPVSLESEGCSAARVVFPRLPSGYYLSVLISCKVVGFQGIFAAYLPNRAICGTILAFKPSRLALLCFA